MRFMFDFDKGLFDVLSLSIYCQIALRAFFIKEKVSLILIMITIVRKVRVY
jgi:hypothetical protein